MIPTRIVLATASILFLANLQLLANGGAWQPGVPVTGNAAASDQKRATNVTIEDEKLVIDLHQEFAAVEVRYRMKNTGGEVAQDSFSRWNAGPPRIGKMPEPPRPTWKATQSPRMVPN